MDEDLRNPFAPPPYEEPEVEMPQVTVHIPEVLVTSPFELSPALTPDPEALAVDRVVQAGGDLREALVASGIDATYLTTKVIKKGLKATRSQYNRAGELVETTPDHNVRHKFLTTVLEVRGDVKSKADKSSAGDSWEEILMLVAARKAAPPAQ